jgi:DNA repair protein RadC
LELRISAYCSLRDALSLVDVRVLDHFVVAAGESMSFAERGML